MLGDSKFNMEDVFFRDLTVCVLDTLEGQIRWVNRFSSGDYPVDVPFYYSLTGDERFLLDSFQDDIVSENRFIELNTDIIPRGHLTLKSFNIKSDEFANPNVWLRMVVENEVEIRKILAKVRAVPITVEYDLTILLSNEIDTFKCSQAILDTLWVYKFMYFEHNFMNIDAVMLMPDTNQIEINREKNLSNDNTIKLTVSFQVETYYPAFRRDRINASGYPKFYGDGAVDSNGYNLTGGFSEFFPPTTPTQNEIITGIATPIGFPTTSGGSGTGGTGGTSGSSATSGTGGTSGSSGTSGTGGTGGSSGTSGTSGSSGTTATSGTGGGTSGGSTTSGTAGFNGTTSFGGTYPTGSSPAPEQDDDYFIYAPKRTRWFNNILKARQRSSRPIGNPFGQSPNPNNTGRGGGNQG